jgi:hypothetical protein
MVLIRTLGDESGFIIDPFPERRSGGILFRWGKLGENEHGRGRIRQQRRKVAAT